ncbi:hypothetical protein E2F43_10760 [Seongchinamella unica]|uniref:Uncharacterized protein n=1 Tax=Seongchinamella unica TaxID=2547392 RepID=A0A4R5LT86_9GAMM|nr:hypothetical protein [Seongchinamella unica]TDG13967.1 hypothetical protein E2F43_10760 [Seongchinamella unica]
MSYETKKMLSSLEKFKFLKEVIDNSKTADDAQVYIREQLGRQPTEKEIELFNDRRKIAISTFDDGFKNVIGLNAQNAGYVVEYFPKASRQYAPAEALFWTTAIASWDYGDGEEFYKLLGGDKPIPTPLRPVIAGIARGDRRPANMKNAKIKGIKRAIYGFSLWSSSGVLKKATEQNQVIAMNVGREPMDTLADSRACHKFVMGFIKIAHNYSDTQIKNLKREFGDKFEEIWSHGKS